MFLDPFLKGAIVKEKYVDLFFPGVLQRPENKKFAMQGLINKRVLLAVTWCFTKGVYEASFLEL